MAFLAGMIAYRNSVISYLILIVTIGAICGLIYMSYASGHKAGAFIIGGLLVLYILESLRLYAGYRADVKSAAEELKGEKNRDQLDELELLRRRSEPPKKMYGPPGGD
jgi:hypothetical protein